ncbi:G- coupled receptor 55-like protein [Labeo rohita]|uniref:G-coupled receptor 55-like protein n=2 Tax=Labeo rohita TaxID=84645 RepID=A0A498NZS2_LABRO|nr:G- coupled receptor 55-like protein [Labeo rohita]
MDSEKDPNRAEIEDLESYAVDTGTIPAKTKKGRTKSRLGSRKMQSLEENQLEVQQQQLQAKSLSRPVQPRSHTLDIDRPLERTESLNSRSSFMKHNKTFHKLFPEIPETEDLLHAYVCALQKEVPYHGRLYISDSSLCFFSSVLLKDTKVIIPVTNVNILKKQNTALLVPNAISVRTTDGEKYLFVSLRNREGCYKLLRSVCPQLEDGSANSSPLFSSAENSFDQTKLVQNSSQSSLDDTFEVDGGHVTPQIELSASRLTRENNASTAHGSPPTQDESSSEEYTGSSWVWNVTDRARSLIIQREVSNLNTLLLIYLILPLERTESLNSRSSFMKHNKTFHKLFPEIPETEDLLHAYVCALQKEVPYHGRLYISDSSLCFFSSVLLKDTKVIIPVTNVNILKKQNTALLVPNAISVRTTDGEKVRFTNHFTMSLVFLLLLSSGYIGLRIVALEEQLTSLGALPEFTLQSGYKETLRMNCTVQTSEAVHEFQKVTSIPTFILGVLGNIYVLVVFCRRPRAKWTYMNIYITNMAIADLTLLTFLPFKIHYYDRPLQDDLKALCNFALWNNYVNMYVSIFTITAISVVRYVAIKYPMKARNIFSCRSALVVCGLIWFIICSISPVYFVTDSNNDKTMCFQRVKVALSLHFVLLLIIVGFLMPFLIMLFCSVRVVCTLRKQLDVGTRSEKLQCIFIIVANFIVFVICFLPVHVGYFVKNILQNKYTVAEDDNSCYYKQIAHDFLHVAICISNMNCGLDCFSYFFATKTSWNMCCMNKSTNNKGEFTTNRVSDPVSTSA